MWKSALDRYCSLRVQSMPSPVRMAEGGKVTQSQQKCTDGIGNAILHHGLTRPIRRSHSKWHSSVYLHHPPMSRATNKGELYQEDDLG